MPYADAVPSPAPVSHRPAGFAELVFSDFARFRSGTASWLRVLALCTTTPGMLASVLLRAQECLHYAGHTKSASILRTVGVVLVSADFSPGARVGRGLLLVHPVGVVLGAGVRIGENVTFAGGVTAAASWYKAHEHEGETPEYPEICDGAGAGANAVLMGGVRIGRNSVVGANSVVLADVPDDTTVVGSPARPVGTRT